MYQSNLVGFVNPIMPILVTGAHGQLGGELCRQLGDDAVGLDIDGLDLTDGPAVLAAMRRLRPTAVINCAAYTQVDRAETEPGRCRAVNATAVEHLARACGELDCPLVQISTDYVFGGEAGERGYREDDPPAPQGVYAKTKVEGELAAARHAKHLIVRTCGLYARPSDERAGNFVKTMLRLGASGKPLRVVADQHCTPSYVPHVAQAVLFLLDTKGTAPDAGAISGNLRTLPASGPVPVSFVPVRASWGIYHVTNRGQTTWYDFAEEIFRLAKMDASLQPITTAEYAAAAPRPAYSVLDTTAYHRLGGPAMPAWQAALAEYFAEKRR